MQNNLIASRNTLFKTQSEEIINKYRYYLKFVRNLASCTIEYYCSVAFKLLFYLSNEYDLNCLQNLNPVEIENFLKTIGNKVGRRTTFNVIAALRSFLRFLVMDGKIVADLVHQIDTPRIYREEKLPRSLDWEDVAHFLQSINRNTSIGKRDYAMLFLIASYGLRASEVVNLKLEDIGWRQNSIRIFQSKTANYLLLPMINAVANCIIQYLQQGRPQTSNREVFVKHSIPFNSLKSCSVSSIFNTWVRRCNLSIPFKGPHCLRHSFAVHLLRQGAPLKIIGDLMGHKNFKSTCVYLRLNIDDLREVPLSIPY
jgi:site-specific recombinase XerD